MLAGVVMIGDVVAMLLLAVEAKEVGVGGVTTPRGDVGLPHRRKATSPAGAPCKDEGNTGSGCSSVGLRLSAALRPAHRQIAGWFALRSGGQHRLRLGPDTC